MDLLNKWILKISPDILRSSNINSYVGMLSQHNLEGSVHKLLNPAVFDWAVGKCFLNMYTSVDGVEKSVL